jgi:hypothetical protein
MMIHKQIFLASLLIFSVAATKMAVKGKGKGKSKGKGKGEYNSTDFGMERCFKITTGDNYCECVEEDPMYC